MVVRKQDDEIHFELHFELHTTIASKESVFSAECMTKLLHTLPIMQTIDSDAHYLKKKNPNIVKSNVDISIHAYSVVYKEVHAC